MILWSIYLLWNPVLRRTYIGATTDVLRRLRQHNGEIRGGARSTRKGQGDWELVGWVSGFLEKSVCYRWEKILKMRCWGFIRRYLALLGIAQGTCPPGGRYYEVPKNLRWNDWGVLGNGSR